MKKIISLFLSVIILFSCVSLNYTTAFAENSKAVSTATVGNFETNKGKSTNPFKLLYDSMMNILMSVKNKYLGVPLPTVYISGQGSRLTADGTINSETIYPISVPDGVIGDAAKKLITPLSTALITNRWKEYGDGLFDAVYPFVEKLGCDKNGNVTNGSGQILRSTQGVGYTTYTGDIVGILPCWSFFYDWRLDPNELADQLHEYIEFVKSKTYSRKINVVARCFAGNIMLAYINKYGSQDINDLIFCSIGFDGFESIGAIFAGKIDIDADAVDRFANTYFAIDDYAEDSTFELVRNLCTYLNYTGGVDLAGDVLNRVVKGIRGDALKRLLLCSFGSMPSFWAYVGEDHYEDAKAYLFGGVEDEYKGLIEKLDRYHYDVLVNYKDILKKAENQGTRIYNICKYGIPIIPVIGNSKVMSDSIISTERTSLGATCSPIDGVLGKDYLKTADPKFISPDKQIDASTCMYPEHTWFIKNNAHRNMQVWMDIIFNAIFERDGYTTVFDIPGIPQFLAATDNSASVFPATVENTDHSDRFNANYFEASSRLNKSIFELIKSKL